MRIDLPKAQQLNYKEEVSLHAAGNWQALAEAQMAAIVGLCNRSETSVVKAEDLLSDAWQALAHAAQKWKPDGYRFWTYAAKWVKPAIVESVRKQSGVVVAPKGKEKTICESIHADDEEREIEGGIKEDETTGLEKLTQRQRALFELRFHELDFRPFSELKKEFGVTERTLREDFQAMTRYIKTLSESYLVSEDGSSRHDTGFPSGRQADDGGNCAGEQRWRAGKPLDV